MSLACWASRTVALFELVYGLHPGELPTYDNGMLEKYDYESLVGPRLAIHREAPDSYDTLKGRCLVSSN